jgi:cell fate (sporulation/competence/biofilm development) regulator YlbF (YheA/YmcA/DUF963 family)
VVLSVVFQSDLSNLPNLFNLKKLTKLIKNEKIKIVGTKEATKTEVGEKKMVSEVVREKALALANAILETEEYRDFVAKENVLKNDDEAQKLLMEFQEKQQEFIGKQLSGEVDQELLGQLTEIQSRLNSRESVVEFIQSYNRLLDMLGEVGDIISETIDLDFGEVYRAQPG